MTRIETVIKNLSQEVADLTHDRNHLLSAIDRLMDESQRQRAKMRMMSAKIRKLSVTDVSNDEFEIELFLHEYKGMFEHHEEGEEYAGGLWFKDTEDDTGLELTDYDGVYVLPRSVAKSLIRFGVEIENHMYAGGEENPILFKEIDN